MNLKHFLSKLTINKVSRFNGRRTPSWNYRDLSTTRCISPLLYLPNTKSDSHIKNSKPPIAHSSFYRFVHSSQETVSNGANDMVTVSEVLEEEDEVVNEFLSRFVWIMRGKLTEVYTDADKKEIDAMLHIIVGKVVSEMEKGHLEHFTDPTAASMSDDFSEDLWKTVWEVSNVVLEDMKKAKKKEKMKSFLQSEKVKEMTRFAGEIGIRGDMLRELRFKWARDKLEESEFYESLERMRQEAMEPEADEKDVETQVQEVSESNNVEGENDTEVGSLPKRSGKIKYKIYGLDLSKPKWAEVADKIHEAGENIWPQEPKPISGKCKIATEKILSLQVDDDPSPLIAEWIELLQPSRVDWIALLDRLKEQNDQLHVKVAELVLDEESFQTNTGDYSQLIDAYSKRNLLADAERIIKKMNEKGIVPDILTKSTMIHMYSKAGNLNLAKEAFESLKSQGFQPDLKVYNSMIMAYINAGDLKSAEDLTKNFKPSQETYMALLKSYAEHANAAAAIKIATRMEFAGYHPSLESCTYLLEAYRGQPEDARKNFDVIIKLGYKLDDKLIATMIGSYASKNLLDKGLHLLLKLEKEGVQYGVETYSVLVDWLCKLQLIDEVEDLLGKFSPSLDVQISLCDMYLKAREQKKALQALGVLEANKDKLSAAQFERIIDSLKAGGFSQDAQRVQKLMTAQGLTRSKQSNVTQLESQAFSHLRSSMK